MNAKELKLFNEIKKQENMDLFDLISNNQQVSFRLSTLKTSICCGKGEDLLKVLSWNIFTRDYVICNVTTRVDLSGEILIVYILVKGGF